MIPHEPPRTPATGFLYFPPFRIQGYSIAGEETVVQVPELDLCFDIGRCPRLALASNHVALSHGHMDHAAGLAYYFSQRHFQGMGTGTVLCHPVLEDPIRRLMNAWIDIEAQRTPYKIITMDPGTAGAELEIKNTFFLRAFETMHTTPSLGFSVVEKRSKLREEYAGLPQSRLVELKEAGEQITYIKQVPLITYLGDTAPGDFMRRPEVTGARILVTECTFLEPGHRSRARVGKHLHLSDLVKLLDTVEAEAVVVTHISRRTHIKQAREALDKAVPGRHRDRLHLLMDSRTNRQRYAQQTADAEQAESGA
jgi:ribonuclease Z